MGTIVACAAWRGEPATPLHRCRGAPEVDHAANVYVMKPVTRTLRLGGRSFPAGQPVVMAIVNRTPDSFFDQGATFATDAALAAVATAVAEGAAIIDIGGVKAGPGDEVTVPEEIRRTVDLIATVRAAFPDVVISIDTWRAEVAVEAVAAGADLLNDTWSGADDGLAEVAAATGVGLVCSHAGGLTPRTRLHRAAFDDVVVDVVDRVMALAARATSLGVREDGILIDPAHDFGKNTRHSLEITRRLRELTDTGWPLLVALSNKDFVGETLDLPIDQRLAGTLAATAISAWLGARVFRAHQVAPTKQVLDMVASIMGDRPPAVARRGLA
jgi:dihydropteroate synthase